MATIELLGDDNHVLINDEFKNLIFARKITFTFPNIGGRYFGSEGEVAYTSIDGTIPVVAIRSVGFLCSITRIRKTGSNWLIGLSCNQAGIGATAEVYVYTLPELLPDPLGLLQLFNSQGKLVFDSSFKYMKVEKSFFVTMDNATATALNASKKYAAIQCKLPSFKYVLPGARPCSGSFFAVVEGSQLNGCSFSAGQAYSDKYVLKEFEYCTTSPGRGSWRTKDGLFLIIDVTGL